MGLTTFKLNQNVKRTAKLLDKVVPGWHRRIDMETFDVQLTKHCIYGQLQLEFNEAWKPHDKGDMSVEQGFWSEPDIDGLENCAYDASYHAMLQPMWEVEIHMRRRKDFVKSMNKQK